MVLLCYNLCQKNQILYNLILVLMLELLFLYFIITLNLTFVKFILTKFFSKFTM